MTTQLPSLLTNLRNALAKTGGLAACHLSAEPGPFDTAPLPAGTLALHRVERDGGVDGLMRAEFDLTLWRRDGSRPANAAALAALADAAIAALLADPTQGGLALPGPDGVATQVSVVAPGRHQSPPLGSLLVRFACRLMPADGLVPTPEVDRVTIDSKQPLASGPHVLTIGAWSRRRLDRTFAGLDGTVSIDLGATARPMTLTGRLVAPGREALLVSVAAVESLNDGRPHTVAAPDGRALANVRIDDIEWGRVLSPAPASTSCIGYRIAMSQLGEA